MSCKKFAKEFVVHYYEIDKYKEATPVALLNYLEETAISHSESVGYGLDKLKSVNAGWVLSRWNVIIDKYPQWNERIVIETWPSSFDRFYATREFYIKNSDGEIIGKAASLWIYFNVEKRRPIRIPAEIGEAYGLSDHKAIENAFQAIELTDDWDCKSNFDVRRSDIDTNNHANNTKYVEWILEAVPLEVYNNFKLNAIEIEYKKETNYGSKIYSSCKSENIMSTCKLSHIISDKENSNVFAIAKTLWTSK